MENNSLQENVNVESKEKLPVRVKMMFACADVGKASVVMMNTMFLMYFYTDVLKIGAGIAATILLIARIWDLIWDPIMGVLLEKTKSEHGKCRFFIRIFALPAAVCFALSYAVPNFSTSTTIIWVAVTYILQGTAATTLLVPIDTLQARITSDRLERVSVSQYRGFFNSGIQALIPAILLPLVTFFGGTNMRKGFAFVAVLLGLVFFISYFIAMIGTKGYEKPSSEEIAEKGDTTDISVGKMFKALFTNKIALLMALVYLLYLGGISIQSSTLVYYLQYNIHQTSLIGLYSTSEAICAVIPLFFLKFIVKKLGNAGAGALGAMIACSGYIIRWALHDSSSWVLLTGWCLEGLGCGLFASLIVQCMFDSMIYSKWKDGTENQGVVMSLMTLGQKAGSALGGIIPGYLLAMVPYIPQAATQKASVLTLFHFENIGLPIVVYLLLFVTFLFVRKFELTIPRLKKEIAEREAAKATTTAD